MGRMNEKMGNEKNGKEKGEWYVVIWEGQICVVKSWMERQSEGFQYTALGTPDYVKVVRSRVE